MCVGVCAVHIVKVFKKTTELFFFVLLTNDYQSNISKTKLFDTDHQFKAAVCCKV